MGRDRVAARLCRTPHQTDLPVRSLLAWGFDGVALSDQAVHVSGLWGDSAIKRETVSGGGLSIVKITTVNIHQTRIQQDHSANTMDFPLGGIASVLGVLEAVLALVDTASLAHEARRKHRYLEHVKILILDTGRDVEQAREDKKDASRVWSREERDCQRQECHGEIRWFRLSRNISRVMVLYPACMLVMSNYAATRGLLQGCDRLESRPLEVSRVLP